MRKMMLVQTKDGNSIKVRLQARNATVHQRIPLNSNAADLNEISGVLVVPSKEDPQAIAASIEELKAKVASGEINIK